MILLNTNVVSAVMQKHPEPAVLQCSDHSATAARQAFLDQLIQERVALMDALAAQRAARLAAARRAKGRVVDLRDTLIAGIALACEAQLATRNVRHFEDTTISLINPFQ